MFRRLKIIDLYTTEQLNIGLIPKNLYTASQLSSFNKFQKNLKWCQKYLGVTESWALDFSHVKTRITSEAL